MITWEEKMGEGRKRRKKEKAVVGERFAQPTAWHCIRLSSWYVMVNSLNLIAFRSTQEASKAHCWR